MQLDLVDEQQHGVIVEAMACHYAFDMFPCDCSCWRPGLQVTMGIMLAAEPPEPKVMDKPPRRCVLRSGSTCWYDMFSVLNGSIRLKKGIEWV
jgi:hypothetical protein